MSVLNWDSLSVSSILLNFIWSIFLEISPFSSFASVSRSNVSSPVTFSFSQGCSSISLTSFIVLIWFPYMTCSTVSLFCSSVMFSIITLTYSGFCFSGFVGSLVILIISLISAEVNLFFGEGVSLSSIFFDPSLFPHWRMRSWFICTATDTACFLTFIMFGLCVFRSPPTSAFIVTPWPSMAYELSPTNRQLVLPCHKPAWYFKATGFH